jgi:hypothetical protein
MTMKELQMNIRVTLPGWNWVRRLCEWWQPGLQDRASKFGIARANRRFLHGVIDVTTEVKMRDE